MLISYSIVLQIFSLLVHFFHSSLVIELLLQISFQFLLLFLVSKVGSLVLDLFLLGVIEGHHVPHRDGWVFLWTSDCLIGEGFAHFEFIVYCKTSCAHGVAHSDALCKWVVSCDGLTERVALVTFWSHRNSFTLSCGVDSVEGLSFEI